jgi:hypothetical protein
MRTQPIPQQHHPVAGVERRELLQHFDEAVGVVVVGLQVKAQAGRHGAVGVWAEAVAEAAAMEARFHAIRWRRTGVRPRIDQVRRTGGISELPDSSKTTSQADAARAPC